MIPLQVTIGDPKGINMPALRKAIEAGYRSLDGHRVRVDIGQGVAIDGLLPGLVYLTEVPA